MGSLTLEQRGKGHSNGLIAQRAGNKKPDALSRVGSGERRRDAPPRSDKTGNYPVSHFLWASAALTLFERQTKQKFP